jgi:hypothetical protein
MLRMLYSLSIVAAAPAFDGLTREKEKPHQCWPDRGEWHGIVLCTCQVSTRCNIEWGHAVPTIVPPPHVVIQLHIQIQKGEPAVLETAVLAGLEMSQLLWQTFGGLPILYYVVSGKKSVAPSQVRGSFS